MPINSVCFLQQNWGGFPLPPLGGEQPSALHSLSGAAPGCGMPEAWRCRCSCLASSAHAAAHQTGQIQPSSPAQSATRCVKPSSLTLHGSSPMNKAVCSGCLRRSTVIPLLFTDIKNKKKSCICMKRNGNSYVGVRLVSRA